MALQITMHASSAAALYVRSSSQLFSNAVLPLSVLTLYSLYQYAYSPYCSLHKLQGADKENLFNNQEPLNSL